MSVTRRKLQGGIMGIRLGDGERSVWGFGLCSYRIGVPFGGVFLSVFGFNL